MTIVKFTCDKDYDPLAQDAKPEKDCDKKTDDVTFSIIGAKNASISGKTGDDGDGTVTFKNLKAGSYLLQETYPENTQKAFIWTCESDVRVHDYPFAPFARIDETGMIKVSLTPGETLTCDWYNVPSPPKEERDPVGRQWRRRGHNRRLHVPDARGQPRLMRPGRGGCRRLADFNQR